MSSTARNNFRFDFPEQQAVLGLQTNRRVPAPGAGDMHGLGQLPPQKVGEALIRDLAPADCVVEEAQGLLQRADGVPVMVPSK